MIGLGCAYFRSTAGEIGPRRKESIHCVVFMILKDGWSVSAGCSECDTLMLMRGSYW
jgi:hypothetical protein